MTLATAIEIAKERALANGWRPLRASEVAVRLPDEFKPAFWRPYIDRYLESHRQAGTIPTPAWCGQWPEVTEQWVD